MDRRREEGIQEEIAQLRVLDKGLGDFPQKDTVKHHFFRKYIKWNAAHNLPSNDTSSSPHERNASIV